MLDTTTIKKQFPIFTSHPSLVYLDNGASSQKPQSVLDAMNEIYTKKYANIHRGIYALSEQCTDAYEQARRTVQKFINARFPEEIIFTRGTTESINLVAYSWGEQNIHEGDEIVVTHLEHHANFVPWQQLAKKKNATFKVIPITDEGMITEEAVEKSISTKTKIVCVTATSNVLGVIPPLAHIIQKAHAVGAKVMIDAAQSVAHLKTDVQKLNADFLAFSGHKMYGPTGIGVLYGKRELLEAMPPFHLGGSMIREVSVEESTWAPLPDKFEAGTMPIVEAIGLGAAIHFLESCGFDAIRAHEKELVSYALTELKKIPDIRILGPQNPERVSGVVSFVLKNVHAHDVATLADRKNVGFRVGHHCAQPLMRRLDVPSTCRASFGVYNTTQDIDALVTALKYAIQFFAA